MLLTFPYLKRAKTTYKRGSNPRTCSESETRHFLKVFDPIIGRTHDVPLELGDGEMERLHALRNCKNLQYGNFQIEFVELKG